MNAAWSLLSCFLTLYWGKTGTTLSLPKKKKKMTKFQKSELTITDLYFVFAIYLYVHL